MEIFKKNGAKYFPMPIKKYLIVAGIIGAIEVAGITIEYNKDNQKTWDEVLLKYARLAYEDGCRNFQAKSMQDKEYIQDQIQIFECRKLKYEIVSLEAKICKNPEGLITFLKNCL